MSAGIYAIQDGGRLIEMTEQPYDSEDVLQRLLEQYPDLLAGSQIDSDCARRWVLVSREMGVPGEAASADRWSLDHLFLDQDGIPTLVEVKRSSDTRIRREVVGQMLDYAANGVAYWPVETLRSKFEFNCQREGQEPDQFLSRFLDDELDVETFWERVKTNLQAGKIRMLFVADRIPSELQRIIEFLNEQMDPAEVLAVEVKQYVGEGLKTLVPRVIGQTAAAQSQRSGGPRQSRQWDEVSFFDACTPERARAARRILNWAKTRRLLIRWGRGAISGSFIPTYEQSGIVYQPVSVWTSGHVGVNFKYLCQKAPFNGQVEKLQPALDRINTIEGVQLGSEVFDKQSYIFLETLQEDEKIETLLSALDWIIDQIQAV
jgi:hypothetical protein